MLCFFTYTAGYNNVEVAEYLLENGADVNAQDKGGLIPLHNASSYGHVDIAALLIKFNASVNAVDKWGFTPLHEASQKGRTQLCALLVSRDVNGYPLPGYPPVYPGTRH
jgi:tankyrase